MLARIAMRVAAGDLKLNPGKPAFHLVKTPQEGDLKNVVKWTVEDTVPEDVAEAAEHTGRMTVYPENEPTVGYLCEIFETDDGDQWAQKAASVVPDKPEDSQAAIAARVAGLGS